MLHIVTRNNESKLRRIFCFFMMANWCLSVPLHLSVILNYISTQNSYVGFRHRCLHEGEQVLKANHIAHCYMCSGNDDDGTIVTANVVKSSSLKKKPHDLVITIKDDIPAGVPAKRQPLVLQARCCSVLRWMTDLLTHQHHRVPWRNVLRVIIWQELNCTTQFVSVSLITSNK